VLILHARIYGDVELTDIHSTITLHLLIHLCKTLTGLHTCTPRHETQVTKPQGPPVRALNRDPRQRSSASPGTTCVCVLTCKSRFGTREERRSLFHMMPYHVESFFPRRSSKSMFEFLVLNSIYLFCSNSDGRPPMPFESFWRLMACWALEWPTEAACACLSLARRWIWFKQNVYSCLPSHWPEIWNLDIKLIIAA